MTVLSKVTKALKRFRIASSGTVAVEYGVILTAMFLALIPGFLYVSTGIQAKFTSVGDWFGMF